MIDSITTWAEVVGCLALAVGTGWNVAGRLGVGWGLIAFGAAILFMSAAVSAMAGRRKDVPQ